jgi:hypothetical protein
MADGRKPIRLEVVFEADDGPSLIEAVTSFLEDLASKEGEATDVSSMSTGGWRYKSEVARDGD